MWAGRHLVGRHLVEWLLVEVVQVDRGLDRGRLSRRLLRREGKSWLGVGVELVDRGRGLLVVGGVPGRAVW